MAESSAWKVGKDEAHDLRGNGADVEKSDER